MCSSMAAPKEVCWQLNFEEGCPVYRVKEKGERKLILNSLEFNFFSTWTPFDQARGTSSTLWSFCSQLHWPPKFPTPQYPSTMRHGVEENHQIKKSPRKVTVLVQFTSFIAVSRKLLPFDLNYEITTDELGAIIIKQFYYEWARRRKSSWFFWLRPRRTRGWWQKSLRLGFMTFCCDLQARTWPAMLALQWRIIKTVCKIRTRLSFMAMAISSTESRLLLLGCSSTMFSVQSWPSHFKTQILLRQ